MAVPAGHPPAEQGRIRLLDLTAHPIVCTPPGTGLRAVFDRACAAQGIHPDLALRAGSADAIAGLAARGLGVAVLGESMAADHRDRLTARTVDDVDAPALLALTRRRTPGPAPRELLVHSRQACG